MKKLLIVALLPLLFIACAKEEDINPQFRTPTCEDTADDGKFEAFTQPETAQFLKYYNMIADTELTAAAPWTYITGHQLFNRSIQYEPFMVYKIKQPVQFFMYMPLKTQQEQYYSWTRKSLDTSKTDTINIYNVRLLNLQPGCYRMYYVFSDTDTGVVYTKGHYDIEIKQ
jgi:hypothetical protein